MSKTAAQRSREYRRRKRDGVTAENVTRVTESVTESVTDKDKVVVTDKIDRSVATCQARARAGLPWRKGDPVWCYTRHLTPAASVLWAQQHRPSWLTPAKPGDKDYNWQESAVPAGHPVFGGIVEASA